MVKISYGIITSLCWLPLLQNPQVRWGGKPGCVSEEVCELITSFGSTSQSHGSRPAAIATSSQLQENVTFELGWLRLGSEGNFLGSNHRFSEQCLHLYDKQAMDTWKLTCVTQLGKNTCQCPGPVHPPQSNGCGQQMCMERACYHINTSFILLRRASI